MQPTKEETSQLLKYVLPDDCSEEDKESHSIAAEEVVKALKGGKSVEIRNAVIEGPFNLESEVVKGKVTIEHTKFKDSVDCSYATFKHVLKLNGSTFEGDANFVNARIMGSAEFFQVVFNQWVSFMNAQIEGTALFIEATFMMEANFINARIGSNAMFSNARFKQKVIFEGAQIERTAFFTCTIFKGEANFATARIGGNAVFPEAVFKQLVNFNIAKIEGDAFFNPATFEGNVHFVNTSFRTIFFGKEEHRAVFKGEIKIDFRGCTYGRIAPSYIWKELMEKLEPYDRQPFTQLEDTFRKAGEDKLSNDVYLMRRGVEGARIKIWKQPHIWLIDRFLWLFTAYGLQPWRILALSLALVIGGMFIFQIDRAIELKQDTQQTILAKGSSQTNPDEGVQHGWCEGFWLSVRFFLPVEIPFGEEWKASSKTFCGVKFSTIATLLKLAGWVLVPVGIAGLTGILKR